MLTPVDIENKEFTKAFRGYDIYEVEEFMKSLVTDYEKLYRDNAELKEKNAMLNDAIGNYKGMEETMQNAILVAQRTAEDIKQNAYERSETIIKEAERKASEVIDKANRSISNLEKTYLSMQREMNGFKAKMNALLSTYMQLLSDLPEQASSFSNINMPEITAESIPEKQVEETVPGDTNRFTLSSLGVEKEPEPVKEPEAKEEPVLQPKTVETGFETERKVNPLIEELMQKNKEQAQETAPITNTEPFSVVKETVDKEPTTTVSSINLEDLKNFDVFSDDSL
ncbi:MAG: DivIVA domain-containing protein [Clostridia bacterium]|nr:DivIVA domain-containing protein [Clostridia bacterium]